MEHCGLGDLAQFIDLAKLAKELGALGALLFLIWQQRLAAKEQTKLMIAFANALSRHSKHSNGADV